MRYEKPKIVAKKGRKAREAELAEAAKLAAVIAEDVLGLKVRAQTLGVSWPSDFGTKAANQRRFDKFKQVSRRLTYETPELFLSVAASYFDYIDSNPIVVFRTVDKGDNAGRLIQQPKRRPYTYEGLCVYMGITTSTFKLYEKREGYAEVCRFIRDVITTQQLEGAVVGIFQHQLVSRLTGYEYRGANASEGVESADELPRLTAEQISELYNTLG